MERMSLDKTVSFFCFFFCSNCVYLMMEMITISSELWRSADEPKPTWNVLCTMLKGGRNQWTAHPRFVPSTHYSLLHSCSQKLQNTIHASFCSTHFSFFLRLHFTDRSADHAPALPAANKEEEAAAARLSDPLSSSPPSQEQESKFQQPTQFWQPDRLRQR